MENVCVCVCVCVYVCLFVNDLFISPKESQPHVFFGVKFHTVAKIWTFFPDVTNSMIFLEKKHENPKIISN
jgi:hypothetical protein